MEYAHYEIYKQSQDQAAGRAQQARIVAEVRASKRKRNRFRVRSRFRGRVDRGENAVEVVA